MAEMTDSTTVKAVEVNAQAVNGADARPKDTAKTETPVRKSQTGSDTGRERQVGESLPREIKAQPASARNSLVQGVLAQDSLAQDTLGQDTLPRDTTYVILLDPPAKAPAPGRDVGKETAGLSWIVTALLLLFVIVAIRFRNNSKYLGALLRSAVEVRERGNVFDDTVKETSFMIMLNVMWCVCAGILLYTVVGGSSMNPRAPVGMGIAIGIAMAYELFMTGCYGLVGNVFSDGLHARMWVRGYLAATGLTTLLLFPASLLTLCYPEQAVTALWIGGIAFISGKIVFIWKGFRIFFTQISSWVLFLYYLCSLEIVPLILVYAAAVPACR